MIRKIMSGYFCRMTSVLMMVVCLSVLVRKSYGFSTPYIPVKHLNPKRISRTQVSFSESNNHCRRCVRMNSRKDGHDEDINENSIVSRFAYPRIDDAGLPLSDALFAQIIAPSLQIFWLSINHAPIPTWLSSSLTPIFSSSTQGALVGPTLVHGAGLAVCWTMGALAARAYESDAFNVSGGRGYKEPIIRTLKAGAFASGLLVFSTQIDLILEFGRYVDVGESDETDVRLLQAFVEVINDVFFEAVVLFVWRMYRASLTKDPRGRPPDYDPYQ